MRTLTVPAFIADQMSTTGMIAAACALNVTILLPTPSRVGHADTIRPDRATLGEQRPSKILRADMSEAAKFPESVGARQFIDAVLTRNVQIDQGDWLNGRRCDDAWAFIGRTGDRLDPKTTGWLIPPVLHEDDGRQRGGTIDPDKEKAAESALRARLGEAPREPRTYGGHRGPRGNLGTPPSGRPTPSPESIVTSTMRAADIMPGANAQTTNGLMQLLAEELEQALIEHVYAEEAVPANNAALKLVIEVRRRLGLAPTSIQIRPVFAVTIWFTDPGDLTHSRREWTAEVDDARVLQDAQTTGFADFARAHPGMVLTGFQVVMTEMGTN